MTRCLQTAVTVASMTFLFACDDKTENLAPEAPSLEPAAPPSTTARAFSVRTEGSFVDFMMDAPLEKIHGRAPNSMKGDLNIDLSDLSKSNGLVKIDLDLLTIYQMKRPDEGGEFSQEVKNDTQNAHMKTWFQISPDAPADVREQNRWVEFKVTSVTEVSAADVSAMTGAERKVTATLNGDFRLHGRKTTKSVKVEMSFAYDGDKAVSVTIKSIEPVPIGLDEHEVQPRSAFDKLAQKTLAAMGQKVATHAPMMFEFTAALSANQRLRAAVQNLVVQELYVVQESHSSFCNFAVISFRSGRCTTRFARGGTGPFSSAHRHGPSRSTTSENRAHPKRPSWGD